MNHTKKCEICKLFNFATKTSENQTFGVHNVRLLRYILCTRLFKILNLLALYIEY